MPPVRPGGDAPPFPRRLTGMTLVETMLAFGILTAAITGTLATLMSVVRLNRLNSVRVAALQAVNRAENRLESAPARVEPGENRIHAVVRGFKELIGTAENRIAIGPRGSYLARIENDDDNGRLICRFPIPEPGEPVRPSRRARLEMHIHLDEARLNRRVLPANAGGGVWSGLGLSPGPDGTGVDLNLNGRLDDDLLHDYADIRQLVVDITAVFYKDDSHAGEAHRFSRRVLLASLDGEGRKFDPTLR